jgi:hypothetical protein
MYGNIVGQRVPIVVDDKNRCSAKVNIAQRQGYGVGYVPSSRCRGHVNPPVAIIIHIVIAIVYVTRRSAIVVVPVTGMYPGMMTVAAVIAMVGPLAVGAVIRFYARSSFVAFVVLAMTLGKSKTDTGKE